MSRAEADPEEIQALHREAQRKLEPLNEEIKELVARNPDSTPEELVPAVEVIMRRYAFGEPSREGVLQWIDQAITQVRVERPGEPGAAGAHRGRRSI